MIDLRQGEIVDILPESLKRIPEVRAVSYAIKRAMAKWFPYIDRTLIYPNVDNLDASSLTTWRCS